MSEILSDFEAFDNAIRKGIDAAAKNETRDFIIRDYLSEIFCAVRKKCHIYLEKHENIEGEKKTLDKNFVIMTTRNLVIDKFMRKWKVSKNTSLLIALREKIEQDQQTFHSEEHFYRIFSEAKKVLSKKSKLASKQVHCLQLILEGKSYKELSEYYPNVKIGTLRQWVRRARMMICEHNSDITDFFVKNDSHYSNKVFLLSESDKIAVRLLEDPESFNIAE
ncbi:MAG: hypothetical protein P1V18_03130 [Candidatus Gracilibacteria bacterium]|nr:hypothetical protein [Candidatus Gracilibacteria bacterium]